MRFVLPLNSHGVAELSGLLDKRKKIDGISGSYLNDANVTATILDAAGVEVAGQNWPLQMPYVAGSYGTYRGVVEDDLEVNENTDYTAKVVVIVTIDGDIFRREFYVTVEFSRCD